MSARLASLLIWALAAASAVFWGLKIWARPQPVPAHASVVSASPALQGDLTRLLGADPVVPAGPAAAAPAADARFTLVGVVSPRGNSHQREALALISVDGKPARTYRVGAVVEGERVLQSVNLRGAALGPRGGGAQVSLSMPAMAEAARGFPGAARLPGGPQGGPQGGPPGLPGSVPHSPPWGQGQPTPPENAPQPVDAPVPGQDRSTLR